jgi:hypothetical protein
MSVGTARGVAAAAPKQPIMPGLVPYHGSAGGGSDIQSGGAQGYGSAQANAFKQTPAYHQAVVDTFLHQSSQQQHAILQGAFKNPTLEGQTVINYLRTAAQAKIPSDIGKVSIGASGPKVSTGPSGLQQIGQFGSNALGTAQTGLNSVLFGGRTGGAAGRLSAGFGAPGIGRVLLNAPIDIARAGLESPSTVPKTITGLGSAAVGGLAGIAELPYKMATEGPGTALSQLGSGIAHDYSQRYGPLVAGNDRAFINRIKQQGAGPELLDALGLTGGVDATLGRAATGLAKTRAAMTGTENFLTRDRPGLRISGGDARSQGLARGAMKITAQRMEDRLRAARGEGQTPLRPGEVAPLFRNHATNVLVSNIAAKTRRGMQESLNREVRHGAEQAARKLTPFERKAMPLVIEGTIPLRSGKEAALAALDARAKSIIADRASNPLSPGNRIPPQIASQVDELHLIRSLQANPDKWLTSRLANYVDTEGARSARLEQADLRLQPATAEARRLRPQGEALGIEHPVDTVARATEALRAREAKLAAVVQRPGTLGELHAARGRLKSVQNSIRTLASGEKDPAMYRAYSAQVRAAAAERGLPAEPAYLMHSAHPKTDFGAYTQGMGARAMPGVKQSQFILHRAGVVDRSPQRYFDSVAKQIKGSHQWRLVDEQFRRNALPAPTAAAIREALGHAKAPADLTGHELSQALMHMGVDLKHVKFYNPGRVAEASLADKGYGALHGSRAGGAPPELETNAAMHDALNQHGAVQDGKGLNNPSEQFVKTAGWKALPRNAFDEIHSSLQPSGKAGRIVGKVQGAAAGAILGGSPSFVIMNTLAHAVLATAGTRGRILTDAVKFPMWWHGLSTAAKDAVKANAGGRGEFRLERLGSTANSDILRSWQHLQQSGIMRAAQHLNPMRALFRVEDMQSNFFRHMVYYSRTKQMALSNMGRDLGPAAAAAQRLQHMFTVGPKDQMLAHIQHLPDAEELGRQTVNMMGDYARFTSQERRWLNNRAVLFYSFLRHASRTLFYVLPFKHPIATALVGEMAKLHNDEVQKLLGGKALPWADSRLFFTSGGKLSSIDMMRASPVGSAVTDIPSQGVKGLGGFIAPEIKPWLDMWYGHTSTGQPVPDNVFTLFNDYASMSYPYRFGTELRFGTHSQQADSIPFLHERPAVKKTAAAQAYQAAKEAANGPNTQRMLAGMLGLYPKPDDSRVISQHGVKGTSGKYAPLFPGGPPGSPSSAGKYAPLFPGGSGSGGGSASGSGKYAPLFPGG